MMRFREFVREPETLFWVFVFPSVLAVGLGVAFRDRPSEILKVAAVTPELANTIRQETLLEVEELALPSAEHALRIGKVVLLVVAGDTGTVQYRYDDSRPEGRLAQLLADRAIQRAAGRVDPVKASEIPEAELGSRYIDFLVPGLVGFNLMNSAVWGVGYSIVDARRKKLLKRLIATPMPRHFYLLSFLIWRLLLLVVEVGILLGIGVFVFQVPLRGSGLDFTFLCVLSSLSFTALGLLIASRLQTNEAASGLTNLIMMPMAIVSGLFFSAQRFPVELQPVIKALPLTAAIDALRANMLQGASLSQLSAEMGVLAIWLIVCFTLAMKLFRWQ